MQSNVDVKKEMGFDSSLSSIDTVLSNDEYVNFLVNSFKKINEERFPNDLIKQRIRKHKDRITGSCPYCGDSMKSSWKQRGNIVLTGKFANFYKCHNCGIFKRVDTFFEDYNIKLDLSIVNYISNGLVDFSSHINTKYDMSLFLDMESIDKYAINREEFKNYFKVYEIKDFAVSAWLKNRLQYDTQKFLYDPRLNQLIILNLTHAGKILGAQKRLFKGSNKYLTLTLIKIYELMNKDSKEIPEEINVLSQLFNICLIDYSKSVTLFEGPFDSFLFKNSIANAGAHKHFPLDISLRYWYDDDKDGKELSIEKLNEGAEVFLWGKLKYDLNLPPRSKWDLNDVLIYLKTLYTNAPNFNDYFSNYELDIIDI
jgi:hypothetical protein